MRQTANMYCNWADSTALALAASLSYLAALLRGLGAKEGRVIGIFAVHQRNEAQVAEFFLTAVGDGNFSGALERHFAFVGLESVGGADPLPGRHLQRREWPHTNRSSQTQQSSARPWQRPY